MEAEIVRHLSPEEEELAAKREELTRLEAQLAEQELLIASLKAELASFEGLYLRRIGVLYAELDDWNARIAELDAEQSGTSEAKAKAADARTQAEDSYSTAHGEAAEVQPFKPSPELKKLYREASKRVHPDTANDEADRVRREHLMQQVNAAYVAGDEETLRRILTARESSPDAVQGSGVGADLIRVLRQLKLVRSRIAAIEMEIRSLSETNVAKLKTKADFSASEGRDLLAEMAANIQGRISIARQAFEKRSSERADR